MSRRQTPLTPKADHAAASMFTICPKCALTLVVTAADLRVAQGYVRCGRCSSVFNALARLTDDRQGAGPASETDSAAPDTGAAAEPDSPAQSPASARPGADADDEPIPEDALEFNPATTDVEAVFIEPPPNPQWTAATGSFRAMVAANQEPEPSAPPDAQVDVEIDAAYLATLLRSEPAGPARESGAPQPPASEAAGSTATAPEREPVPEPSPAATPRRNTAPARAAVVKSPALPTRSAAARSGPAAHSAPTARHSGPHPRPPAEAVVKPSPTTGPRPRATPEPRREVREPVPQPPGAEESGELTLEEESAPGVPIPDRGTPSILRHLTPQRWRIGAAVALLLLAAQIVNHYRDDLAATARFNRPLTALYSLFGVRLAPHWDLRAYDVRQLGASVDGGGTGLITVRASIKNAASQPQPLPLLRVTLQDRFGNRIAARDVAPRFYVPPAMPASSFLSGGQRIDTEMSFVDPGSNAVGFEIDACLPASGGGVTCANDVSVR
jgi:predicted Zn finger-like uncharacterized protein